MMTPGPPITRNLDSAFLPTLLAPGDRCRADPAPCLRQVAGITAVAVTDGPPTRGRACTVRTPPARTGQHRHHNPAFHGT
jgi:hypothetical protein